MAFSGELTFFCGSGCSEAYHGLASEVPKQFIHCSLLEKPIIGARADVREGRNRPSLSVGEWHACMGGKEWVVDTSEMSFLAEASQAFVFGNAVGPNGGEASVVVGYCQVWIQEEGGQHGAWSCTW